MLSLRITEKTAKRVAYTLMAWFLMSMAVATVVTAFWPVTAMLGLAAGLWMGRLSEALATRKGSGLVLAE